MTIEQTLFIIKPDAQPVRGEIVKDLLFEGFQLDHLCQARGPLDAGIWERHYAEHVGKDFFQALIQFQRSGPVSLMVLSRDNAIRYARYLIGPTDLNECAPWTLRGKYRDWSIGIPASTLVHASDSRESAAREIALWARVCHWSI